MGRTLEFHNHEALHKAMLVFWEKGFEHCSLSNLLEKMEISTSSFYNTFGSKKSLYLKTLEIYYEDLKDQLEKLLASNIPFKKKIHALFKYPIDRQLATDVPKGCFLINSVSADALEDQEIYSQIRGYLDHFEHTLEEAIRQAILTGELDSRHDPRLTAGIMNFYLQGMMKLALLSYPTSRLHQQTRYFLDTLGL